jgi:hypothetical protein
MIRDVYCGFRIQDPDFFLSRITVSKKVSDPGSAHHCAQGVGGLLFDPWSFMLVLAVVLLKAPVFKQIKVSSSVRTVLEVGWSRKWFFLLTRNS